MLIRSILIQELPHQICLNGIHESNSQPLLESVPLIVKNFLQFIKLKRYNADLSHLVSQLCLTVTLMNLFLASLYQSGNTDNCVQNTPTLSTVLASHMELLLTFLTWPTLIYCTTSYTGRLSTDQLFVLQNVRINQTDYTCSPINSSPDACKQYCKVVFNYNPNFLYNNKRYFNDTTKLCQSQVICDLTIYILYDPATNLCNNLYYGTQEPSKNATEPAGYANYPLWTFFCMHGCIVRDPYGVGSCLCQFGWESSWSNNGAGQIALCDSAIKFYRYLPKVNQPYYMVSSDIMPPQVGNPSYYTQALKYCFRTAKYYVQNYFQPYQLQIGTVFMTRQSLLVPSDYPYIVIPCIGVVLVILLTVRYKCIQMFNQQMQRVRDAQNQAVGDNVLPVQ